MFIIVKWKRFFNR